MAMDKNDSINPFHTNIWIACTSPSLPFWY